MNWGKSKIGDHCEITSSKRIFFSEYVDQGVPFYRSKEIIERSQGEPISEPLFISEDKYDEIRRKFGVPQPGDMLLTSVGTIGIPYIINADDHFYFKDGNLTWFKDFDDELDPHFLCYWIKSAEGYGVLYNTTIGSSQKALTIAALKKVECPLPPIVTQKKIVDILSSYDALILNNQKQIKLLEEAAQRLYKEWFVDLRFPGHENTEIIDGVPARWKQKTIEDLCLKTKNTIAAEDIPKGTPYIGLEHIPRHDFCLSEWGDAADISSSKAKYKKYDIIFGQIRPYFHKVGFALNDGVASTDSFIMTPQKETWGLFLLTVFSDAFVNYSYQTCKEGAKMPRADWNQMKKYPILVANKEIQIEFEQNIVEIIERVRTLALQIRYLSEARDRLLPKLMSGEIEL